jgi:hypothetical protein
MAAPSAMVIACPHHAPSPHPPAIYGEKLIPRRRLLCSWQLPQTIVSPVASLISRPRRSQQHNNSNPLNDLRLLSPKTHFATEVMATSFKKTGQDHRMSRIDRIKKQ